jgi:hypothetical protein
MRGYVGMAVGVRSSLLEIDSSRPILGGSGVSTPNHLEIIARDSIIAIARA